MILAKKSLSQNFLIDIIFLKKLLINRLKKKFLEIGPGYGFLTDEILKKKKILTY